MNQGLWAFIWANAPELGIKLLEQLYLVSLAVGSAMLVGLPLGIWIYQRRILQPPILGFASILQTIPSLALLAFLLPFLGIGTTPALVAIGLYAFLPIVRNTLAGLQSVPKHLIEAARALGFTKWQRLRLVELPLALPVIMAGIRTALSMAVGIATLAAFIGAGGLGDFINQGLALNNTRLVLLGAIPAALLALVLDGLLAYLQRLNASILNRKTLVIAILIGLLAAIPIMRSLGLMLGIVEKPDTIKVATKNFTEQVILGHMLAQVIEAKTDLKVERKFNLGSTAICHPALVKGEIDIYPEYTGTAYLLILNREHTGASPEAIYQTVKQAYQSQFDLVWLQPFGFNNTQALAVRRDFAEQHQLQTISDLLPLNHQLKLGASAEFRGRPDGMPGLTKVYQLQFASIQELDMSLMYKAAYEGYVDVIAAFSTDGRIPAYQLQILEDDKNFFPPYYAVPVIRQAVLKAHPELEQVMQLFSGLISDDEMQRLNYEVDLKKRSPAEVAREFLTQKGIL